MAELAEELKRQGNEKFKAQRYDEALELYTQALQHDHQNVFLFSNRSLVFFKLNRYEEALRDAEQCVRIKPQWAKGYLRKSAPLQGLNKEDEVRKAAAAGFKFTNDIKMKSELVGAWCKAMEAMHKIPDSFELPPGITVLSMRYKNVLAYLFRSMDGVQPLTQELTERCLCDCADQIVEALEEFGESTNAVVSEWACYISQEIYPYATNPGRKDELASQISDKTSKFIHFLSHDVDPSLYKVIRPILGLMVLVVINRTNILCESNTGHHSTELMNMNVIKLLECPILKDIPAYHSLYIGRLSATLDCFIGRGYKLETRELQTIDKLYKTLENAVTSLPQQSKERILAERILSNVRGNILQPSQLTPPQIPIGGELSVEMAEQLVCEKPEEVKAFISRHQCEIMSKSNLRMRDVEDLLTMTGIFLSLKDRESALKVFNTGEQAFFTVIGDLLSKNVIKLDECAAAITPIRQLVFTQASLLDSPSLFADITVRWKSLLTELRCLLVERGLGSLFRNVFDWYKVEKSKASDISEESTGEILTFYNKKEQTLLQDNAVSILDYLRKQSYSMVAQKLNEGEIILEYIFFATTQANPLLDAFCIVLSSFEKPSVLRIDFAEIRATASKIKDLLTHLLEEKDGEMTINPLVEEGVRLQLRILMSHIIPKDLIEVLSVKISHLFICTDADIATLPLEMMSLSSFLPNLSSDFSLTTLFSSRELLRSKKDIGFEAPSRCCIVSDPDYDFSLPQQSVFANLMMLTKFISSFGFDDSSDKAMKPLPYSQVEAKTIEKQLRSSHLPVQIITGNKANLSTVLSIARPMLLHISTHAEAVSSRSAFRDNFWSDLNSSIILAGYNTYALKKYSEIDVNSGTGKLPALAICSMDLRGTQLVFLSTCSSAVGKSLAQEAVGSLVEAFQLAGAETVIATLWPISDCVAAEFCEEFYSKLLHKGTRPSLALKYAKESMKTKFNHLFFWGSFTCYGADKPLIK